MCWKCIRRRGIPWNVHYPHLSALDVSSSGKTISAELTMMHLFNEHPDSKVGRLLLAINAGFA
jgi:hypothetical protein